MFPRTRRFTEFSSQTPAPGSYNLEIPKNDNHKKFGFIDKSKRFNPAKPENYDGDLFEYDSFKFDSKEQFKRSMNRMQKDGSDEEIAKLKRDIERWQEQYDRLLLTKEKEMSQLEERLQKQESLSQIYVKEKNSLQTQLTAKENEVTDWSRRYKVLRVNLEKSEKAFVMLQEKLSKSTSLERKNEDLEKLNQKLTAKIKHSVEKVNEKTLKEMGKLKAENLMLQSKNAELSKEIDKIRDEETKKTAQLEQNLGEKQQLLEENVRKLDIKSRELEQNHEQFLKEKAALDSTITSLKNDLKSAQNSASAKEEIYQQEITGLKKKIESFSATSQERESQLSDELKRTTGRMSELNDALKEAKDEARQLRQKNEAQKSEFGVTVKNIQEKLKAAEIDLKKAKIDLDSEKKSAKVNLSSKDSMIASLQADNDHLVKECSRVRAMAEHVLGENKKLASKVDELESEITDWKEKEESWSQKHAQLEKTNEKQFHDLLEIQNQRAIEVENFSTKIMELEGELEKSSTEYSENRNSWESKLTDAMDKIKTLEEAVIRTETERSSLSASLRKELQEKEKLLQQLDSKVEEIEGCQDVIQSLNGKLEDLTQDLEHTEQRLAETKNSLAKQLEQMQQQQASQAAEAAQIESELMDAIEKLQQEKSTVEQNLSDERQTAAQTSERMQSNIKALELELKSLESRLHSTESSFSEEKEAYVETIRTLISHLQSYYQTRTDSDEQNDVDATLQTLWEQTHSDRQVMNALQREVKASQEVIASLQKQVKYLAEEADFYKASYCDSVEAMDSSTSRSNSVSDILTSTQQQMAAIETSSTSVDEISAMFNTMSLLSDAYATVSAVQSRALREELQATESEFQAIAYSTSEKEARIAQLTSELHGIQRSVDDKHLKYKLRIQELEHSLQNSEVRYRELEKKLLKEKELQSKSMKMDYDKLKDEFNQLEKKFRANRMTAEEKQSLTSRLNEFESENSRLQQDLQAEQEKFQSLAEEHIQVTATLQHQIDTLSGVSSFAEHEASKLNELNASLLGHHNQKQRIKYVAKIKEENLSLKKENLLLSKARDQCRMKIMNLERELEAFTSIDNTGKKRGRVEKAVLGTQFDKENASTLF